MLLDLTYFLNGLSLMFFGMAAVHMYMLARKSGSHPHFLFALCLGWMAVIEAKEFFLSYAPGYYYEVLHPGYTLPDLFTLPLLSVFFFELVMPGRITSRYAARLLTPFIVLAGAYLIGLGFESRVPFRSLEGLFAQLPAYQPAVLLLYVLYTAGYCVFALTRIIVYSIRYAREIAQAYSFSERIHLRWLRYMSAVLAFYLISYITIIAFTSSPFYSLCIYVLSLAVWSILYGCIVQYRIPEIIRNYWQEEQPAQASSSDEEQPEQSERIAYLRRQVETAIEERKLYLDPGLTIVEMASQCGTNRTHLSQFFNNELGMSFRDYINRCRIEYAESLMLETDHKIEKLAQLSGFGSTTTFYRAFAKGRKMTPQQWIESRRRNDDRGGEIRTLGPLPNEQYAYAFVVPERPTIRP